MEAIKQTFSWLAAVAPAQEPLPVAGPCTGLGGDSKEAGQGQAGSHMPKRGAGTVGWCGPEALVPVTQDPGWSWRKLSVSAAPGRLQTAQNEHISLSGQLCSAWPAADPSRAGGSGQVRGLWEVTGLWVTGS